VPELEVENVAFLKVCKNEKIYRCCTSHVQLFPQIAGLLSIIVEAYREKVIEDAWIVPVSMNYDRILEGNFVREQLGQPKKKETFYAAISTFIKAICSHYGIMRVDFNKPYRLRVC